MIHGASCLDLFAGSGALGLEALSRGAAFSQFIDTSKKATEAIQSHLNLLNASSSASVIQLDGLKYLQQDAQAYDLVFLDPPYQLDLMAKVVPLLEANGWLANNAMVYLEIEKRQSLPELPANWQQLKEKTAGEVHYFLFRRG